MATSDPEEIVEIYHTDSELVARQVVDVLLHGEGIEGVLLDRKVAMLPGAGQSGGIQIGVHAKDRERAEQIIAEAEDNGYLDRQGEPTLNE
jgi:hypothetical protein